jgi:allophanate hydrolase
VVTVTALSSPALAATAAARSIGQPAFISLLDERAVAAREAAVEDGPLRGIPFAVKDNLDVAGLPSTGGCPTRTAPATSDSAAVARLAAAGAVPIGKTNMDQFATGLVGTRSPYGACHSVVSPLHVSGGSSSGSAVAVASGVVPLALGTDTAGSGRVPAAFNGLVGMKPTRGLVSTSGLLPACPSLDCVTTFTRTVSLAATALGVLAAFDPDDPWSRPAPLAAPPQVATDMRVIAVPRELPDLDAVHAAAWSRAVEHAATLGRLVPVDIAPFLEAARLLYGGPFVAERYAAFGALLEPDGPHLDPTVRSIVLGGRDLSAAELFAAMHRLAQLKALAMPTFVGCDAVLLPVTPGHPTLAEVAADPVGVNSRLGTYTNMVNLLDLCALALPAGSRSDGLPFGVQLVAPAFADRSLLTLGARWTGEGSAPALAPGRELLAVCGAHLSDQPKNGELLELGGRLHRRARTAEGYRMHLVPGAFPRPGLVTADRGAGIDIEVWDLPAGATQALFSRVAPPLTFGPTVLDDGTTVTGFVVDPSATELGADITEFGGWRSYLLSIS